jgi:hypothetical protein
VLSGVNLVQTDQWHDLFTRQAYDNLHTTIKLRPYQCVWISNK